MPQDFEGYEDEDYGPERVQTETEYRVRFHAYCGMRTIDETFEDEDEARAFVARKLRSRRRSDHLVSVSAPGKEYRILLNMP